MDVDVVGSHHSDGASRVVESKADKEQTYNCKPRQLLTEDQDA